MNQPAAGEADPGRRLYGMMQFPMTQAAGGSIPEPGPARGIVTADDALDAVLQLAAVIDWATQGGLIPFERGIHAAAMLMVLREHVRALPPGILPDGTDGVDADLGLVVKALRQAGSAGGVQGQLPPALYC